MEWREIQKGRNIYTLIADHVVIQQKPTQHCKAIIFQLKNFKRHVNDTFIAFTTE